MSRKNRRQKTLPVGEFSAEIVDLIADGRGVARINGKATFIADSLPGEIVRFKYTRTGRDLDEGRIVAIDKASPDRVDPKCAHFGTCGGCSLQHLAPESQIIFKQKQLLEAFARIGKVTPEEIVAPITGAVWGYRRRARLSVKHVLKKGGVTYVGFRERDSLLLAALESCHVLDPRVGMRLQAMARMIDHLDIRLALPQIEIAVADHVAMVIRVNEKPSDADLERLRQFATDEGVDIYLQAGGPETITPLSAPARVLDYSPDGSEQKLRFQPTDFIQINGSISQQIVRRAIEWLAPKPGERVLELFCGLGNFSAPLAKTGVELVAVEGEAGLVQRARENAERLGLKIQFDQADLFTPSPDAPWMQGHFDAVLLDPPRSGAKEMMPLIAVKKPKRIVYVSCHPGTLARDAGTLVNDHGYKLVRAGVMDMFPHTAHVESMALFERVN
ncbi:MAG: 23S rRNA (uracil(1939)-C(5))-methyltransferase RlmD [Pseudomonadota bacterium]